MRIQSTKAELFNQITKVTRTVPSQSKIPVFQAATLLTLIQRILRGY